MKYKAVIFDLDGTLIDSMGIWLKVDIEYLEKRNITVIRDDIKGSNLAEITYTYGVHHGADLISIVSNQRGTPVNMPISTTAQHMVNHSPIPVLSIHPDYKMA